MYVFNVEYRNTFLLRGELSISHYDRYFHLNDKGVKVVEMTLTVMVQSPSMSNSVKASLYSSICWSVNSWSPNFLPMVLSVSIFYFVGHLSVVSVLVLKLGIIP